MATLGHQFEVVFLPKNAIFAKISNDFDPHWWPSGGQVPATFGQSGGQGGQFWELNYDNHSKGF